MFLVATAHLSAKSCKDVKRTIEAVCEAHIGVHVLSAHRLHCLSGPVFSSDCRSHRSNISDTEMP